MPADSPTQGLRAHLRPGWRPVFALAWCALIAMTLAAAVLLGGTTTHEGIFFASAAAGEVAMGLISAFLL